MAGCGGGGGGGSTNPSDALTLGPCSVSTAAGNLIYSTVWGSAPSGASQFIEILDEDGFLVRTDSLNRSGAVNSGLNISNISSGVHQLRITLYASSNANGTVLGVSNSALDLCAGGPGGATVTVTSTNANVANTLEVFPKKVTLFTESTQQFFATGRSGSQLAFLAPGSVAWDVTGGVGSASATGQFTATTAGSGSMRAQTTTLSGSSPVTVNERVVTTSKWTVMVFMNAANDLFSYSDQDVNEMEQVADNPDVRFVVQWKQSKDKWPSSSFDGVRRVLVKPDNTGIVVSDVIQNNLQKNGQHLDMGDPQTLNDFIKWTKQNYPAQRYVLILWNHGNGWRRSADNSWSSRAFSYDDQFGSSIQTWELDEALQDETVDILAWDSSLMQMMEVAYEARDYADYVVGSEESPPGEGYPYHLVFDPFRDNPDASTATLAKGFVDGMLNYAPYDTRKITQSVLDTSQLDALATSIDNLAGQLIANAVPLETVIPAVRNQAQGFSSTEVRIYRDLVNICELLEANGSVPASVKSACVDVRAKVAAALVWEGHNSNSPGSEGIAIDFSSGSIFASFRFDYLRMKIAQDTRWDEYLTQAP